MVIKYWIFHEFDETMDYLLTLYKSMDKTNLFDLKFSVQYTFNYIQIVKIVINQA